MSPKLAAAESESRWMRRAVGGFALWTLACQLTVLTGGNLTRALLLFTVFSAAAALAVRRSRRSDQSSPPSVLPTPDRRERALFLTLAAITITMTAVAHRPDIDDASYISLAVSALDEPELPIMTWDRQHDLEPPKTIRRVSRGRSFEMAAAAVAGLTGFEPILVFHVVFPPLAALGCLLAYRFLYRLVLPAQVIPGIVASLVFLVGDGGPHRSFGNFSFVRLHQGKAVLLTVMVPWLLASAYALGKEANRRRGLHLASGAVTAIGLSSSAFLVVPLAISLGFLSACNHRNLRRGLILIGGTMALAFVQLLALQPSFFRGIVVRSFSHPGIPHDAWWSEVFPTQPGAAILLGCVLCGVGALVHTGSRRRLCLLGAVWSACLVLDLTTFTSLVRLGVPAHNSWRLWWTVPVPVLFALCATLPVTLGHRRLSNVWTAAVLAAWLISSPHTILATANGVRIAPLSLKIPPEDLAIVRRLLDRFGEEDRVLAPEAISAWLPTFRHHPDPLLSRTFYAGPRLFADQEAIDRRQLLLQAGKPETLTGRRADRFVRKALDYGVDGILLREDQTPNGLADRLSAAGYRPATMSERWTIWSTSPRTAPPLPPPPT